MKYKWKRTSDGDLLTYFKDEYGKEKYMIFGEPGKKDGWYITHSDPEKPMYGGKRGLESWFDIRNGQINRDIKDKQEANELKQKIKRIYNDFLSASKELENMRSAFNKEIVANKLNKIAKKIARIFVAYEFEEVKPVFDKEAKQLVDKINQYFKKNGLKCYFSIVGNLYYYAGYRMKLKFNAIGDKKGKEWWEWVYEVEGFETKNLVFKKESNPEICLKKTYRPESHRGQIKNF